MAVQWFGKRKLNSSKAVKIEKTSLSMAVGVCFGLVWFGRMAWLVDTYQETMARDTLNSLLV